MGAETPANLIGGIHGSLHIQRHTHVLRQQPQGLIQQVGLAVLVQRGVGGGRRRGLLGDGGGHLGTLHRVAVDVIDHLGLGVVGSDIGGEICAQGVEADVHILVKGHVLQGLLGLLHGHAADVDAGDIDIPGNGLVVAQIEVADDAGQNDARRADDAQNQGQLAFILLFRAAGRFGSRLVRAGTAGSRRRLRVIDAGLRTVSFFKFSHIDLLIYGDAKAILRIIYYTENPTNCNRLLAKKRVCL